MIISAYTLPRADKPGIPKLQIIVLLSFYGNKFPFFAIITYFALLFGKLSK
jgi:hypothetical protein